MEMTDIGVKPSAILNDNGGERMVPETSGAETFWEHIYRYAFASQFVRDKRVLDIACGEGYGTASLRRAGARSVVGVDVSEAACLHARERYGVDARQGTAEGIPLGDSTVDIVVSFETLEHVEKPLRFLDECARVLTPGGLLIVSTPNKGVYRLATEAANPHHCSEMGEHEFREALLAKFRHTKFYTQRPRSAGWWSLRSFASEENAWSKVGFVGRVHRSAQFRLTPHVVRGPDESERNGPEKLIPVIGKTLKYFWDPYGVRPLRRWTDERPMYLIAIAYR